MKIDAIITYTIAARIRLPAEPKITPLHEYNFKSHFIVNAGTEKNNNNNGEWNVICYWIESVWVCKRV